MCHKCNSEVDHDYEHTTSGNLAIISVVVGFSVLMFACLVPFVLYP